jgi:outer membrane protein assembly factor BamB
MVRNYGHAKEFKPQLPESAYKGGNNSWHGYSSSTPTTDGTHLYVFFGKSGVYCLDLDGKQVWHAEVGSNTRGWGSSNSPVLFNDLLIINASVESGKIVALDKKSGEQVWESKKLKGSWNTPLLVQVGDKTELVYSLPEQIVAIDPTDGKELWTCEGIPDRGYVVPSAITHAGIVYVIGGRKNTAIAVKAGGRGDVTKTHRLWNTPVGSNVVSPVYHNGYIFWVHEKQGIANCLNAQTGEVVYKERLEPRPGIVYSSGLAADGKVYAVSQHNGTYVLAAKPEFEVVAHNTFEDDDARANASPIVSRGQLLLRNDAYLYCIGM